MNIIISEEQANVIQVAIDHLYEEHTDILVDALHKDYKEQARQSYRIQRMIEEIHEEIELKLTKKYKEHGK